MENRKPRSEPISLVGRWVRLEPLTHAHADALAQVCDHEEIWRYLRVELRNREAVEEWIAAALVQQENGAELPFAIIDLESGDAVGSTRYFTPSLKDRGLEIGWTWLTPARWRTPVNSECKYLLLQHAFERLNCIRVQLVTDSRNERSSRAIARLGAKLEGTMRRHMIMRDGCYRDSLLYSIIDIEWPAVKERLAGRLYRR
jgi:RimJ/RimL family protein N-acetyltransferase